MTLRAMRESVGMSRSTPSTSSSDEVPARVVSAPVPSSPVTICPFIAPPLFSDPLTLSRVSPTAPMSGGTLPGSVGVPSLLQFPQPVRPTPGGASTPLSSSPIAPVHPSLAPATIQVPTRPSPPHPAVRPPIEHAYVRTGEVSYWSAGCRPKAGSFLSVIDKDMLSFAGMESSTNAGRIFLHRGLAILDFCEGKYKEAEAKASGLAGEADKWKHYAQTVYKLSARVSWILLLPLRLPLRLIMS